MMDSKLKALKEKKTESFYDIKEGNKQPLEVFAVVLFPNSEERVDVSRAQLFDRLQHQTCYSR